MIRRKAAGSDGSLIEKAITKLESEYLVFDQTNWKKYGETRAEQISNAALELCIVWINRVLFLKLLESQLVEYHEGRASYKFLNKDKVNNFNELSRLFHDVLNCPVVERNQKAAERYPTVPYLNSSLFDHADVEIDTIRIHAIDDNGELDVPRASILRKLGETSDSLPTLEYLFRFLDAYDFASEGKEEVQKENRSLINASVLGKVFEKINGYKDGSIYTPGFITMYMCRQAIRLAVVQKFKDSTDFDGADFEELANWVKDRNYQKENIRRFNAVIDSLKICDPAVGSGHFLVSALNEILAIKSELKIFADADFNTFGDHTIAIANDELVITDRGNHLFEYRIRDGRELNTEMQRLQSTLFHEKQKLIENCLFGVDINPNSVKICRLRLWIELLKNAYYKAETRPVGSVPQADKEDTLATAQVSASHAELETLPNIDINIKEGNSLISRYKLQDKFKSEATNKIIKDYRELIGEAKNVKDRSRKDELRRLVSESKKALSKALEDETTKVKEKLDKKHARLNEVNHPKLFEVTSEAEREMMSRKIQKEIDVLEVELSKIEGKYDNSFEWRLEFPEILDDEGTFLGFDIVIGNPPYMSISKTPDIKGFQLDYKTYDSTGDILCLFYERGHRLLQSDGILCFITSNKWMRSNYGERLRQYFLDNVGLRFLFDFDWFQVFENASVDSNILTFSFAPTSDDFNGCLATPNFEISKLRDFVETNVRPLTFIDDGPWSIIEGTTADLKTKLSGNGTPISNWNLEINRGILTGLNEAFIIDEQTRNDLIDQDPKNIEITQPLLRGQDIQRYGVAFERLWLINSHNGIRERNIPPINVQRDYPSIFEYLQEFETSAKARADQGNHWTNLRNCAYVDQFQNPKIVWAETMRVHRTNPKNFPRFGYDDEGFVVDKTSFFGVGEDLKYLMAVLNSSVGRFLVKRFVDKLDSGGYMMQKSSVEKIPVKRIEGERQIPFIELVDRILELKKTGDDTAELENRIDQMVYDLYELTPDEKAIVEGS